MVIMVMGKYQVFYCTDIISLQVIYELIGRLRASRINQRIFACALKQDRL